ncbi:MAG: GNAT family N-acetyltransferase [Bacteroidota bacterium]
MIMNFRMARATDLETLNAISLQSKAYWGYPMAWMEHWKDDLTLTEEAFATDRVLVMELGHIIIGFSALKEADKNYEIGHLWILPEYIGRGYGKKLLERTLRPITNQKPIRVEADPNAEPFYKSQGFVTVGQVASFPKGRFLPVMQKSHHSANGIEQRES